VFLDIGLPGMSGYEVARTLRDSPQLAGVTLIAFTGYGQDDDRRRVLEAGFDHHLVKPAEEAELARIIDSLPVRA
jgi:CheY-like chemotaxis protein